ncbi:hypothetical protein RRF57_007415 [Xylaria bambusicola]|uniref:Uncharacterized protein n=1 Tax=Xylaria bambusicola TaxID=326684 RepID=A0AAN7ZAE5_9PEZI
MFTSHLTLTVLSFDNDFSASPKHVCTLSAPFIFSCGHNYFTQRSTSMLYHHNQTSSLPALCEEFPTRMDRVSLSIGFELIDPADKIEEETLPYYVEGEYHPMKIGVLLMIFWALKVHIHITEHNQELEIFRHLANTPTEECLGTLNHVQQLKASFKLKDLHGDHDPPMQKSPRYVRAALQSRRFEPLLSSKLLTRFLWAYATFMLQTWSTQSDSDLHLGNLFISLWDPSIMSRMEKAELHSPSPRKRIGDRTIHTSRMLLVKRSDFGQARIIKKHRGIAMPIQYRVSEVILNMEWGNPVHLWSAGLIVRKSLPIISPVLSCFLHFCGLADTVDNRLRISSKKSFYLTYNHDTDFQDLNDTHHLATMTALLGPPPSKFLKRSDRTAQFWNEDGFWLLMSSLGHWIGPVPLPSNRTLESRVGAQNGEGKDNFLDFIKKLRW